MQGHFTVSLIDAQGLKDEDFLGAYTKGRLEELLRQLPLLERAEGKNLVNDNFAGFVLNRVMSGGSLPIPYAYETASAALSSVLLLSTATEPTYTEASGDPGYVTVHNMPGSVNTSSAGKLFIEHDVDTPELAVLPNGQEGIVFRSRFLYLPYEGNTTSPNFINSLGIYFCEDGDNDSSARRGIVARIRLKNSAGANITIQKSSKQVLLVEYEFTLLCV